MRTVPMTMAVLLATSFLPACKKKGEGGKDEAKAETKKEEGKADGEQGEPTLQVAEGQDGVEGPVPPETSMVFYVVEGALLPLACFDKDKGELQSGAPCLKMVETGKEVRLSSVDSAYTKPIGEPAEPQCLAGSGKKVALSVDGIAEGANYKYAAWPPSALKVVSYVPEDTTAPENTQLGDDEQAKLLEAAKKEGGRGDEIKAHQVAEIDVDGDGEEDKVFSLYIPHPTVSEQYAWSGIFWAKGGSLDQLTLLDESKTKRDVFEVRGTLDIDGDESNELWMRLVFEEGSGDRIVAFDDGEAKPIGKWSCGV